MTDIGAAAGTTPVPTLGDSYRRPVDDTDNSSQLDKDTFLKLLVAQMRYQDPLNPTTSEDFIATTAQFTTVEKLDELTKQGANTALINSLTTAGTLVGRTITALRDGVELTATVTRSRISSGEVVLETEQGDVRMNEILAIGAGTPGSTGAAAPAPPAAPGPPDPQPIQPPDPADEAGTSDPEPTNQTPASTDSQETSS